MTLKILVAMIDSCAVKTENRRFAIQRCIEIVSTSPVTDHLQMNFKRKRGNSI